MTEFAYLCKSDAGTCTIYNLIFSVHGINKNSQVYQVYIQTHIYLNMHFKTNIKAETDLRLFPFFFCCAREAELEYQKTLHLYAVASPYSAGKSQGKVLHH